MIELPDWLPSCLLSWFVEIACPFSENTTTRYEEILKNHRLVYKLTKQLKENSLISITWETQGHAKNHESFIAEMMKDGFLEKFEYV